MQSEFDMTPWLLLLVIIGKASSLPCRQVIRLAGNTDYQDRIISIHHQGFYAEFPASNDLLLIGIAFRTGGIQVIGSELM